MPPAAVVGPCAPRQAAPVAPAISGGVHRRLRRAPDTCRRAGGAGGQSCAKEGTDATMTPSPGGRRKQRPGPSSSAQAPGDAKGQGGGVAFVDLVYAMARIPAASFPAHRLTARDQSCLRSPGGPQAALFARGRDADAPAAKINTSPANRHLVCRVRVAVLCPPQYVQYTQSRSSKRSSGWVGPDLVASRTSTRPGHRPRGVSPPITAVPATRHEGGGSPPARERRPRSRWCLAAPPPRAPHPPARTSYRPGGRRRSPPRWIAADGR